MKTNITIFISLYTFYRLWALPTVKTYEFIAATFLSIMTTPSTIQQLPSNIPCLEADGSNWAIFVMHFHEAMQAIRRWPYFEGTICYRAIP